MNVRQRHFRIGCLLAGGLLVLLNLAGCSSVPLVTRPIHTEPTWFVRLDTYQESEKSKALQYDHPAEWNELELATILPDCWFSRRWDCSTANVLPFLSLPPRKYRV